MTFDAGPLFDLAANQFGVSHQHRRDGERCENGRRCQGYARSFVVISGLDHVVVLVSDLEAAGIGL